MLDNISTKEKDVFFPTYERLPIGNITRASGMFIYTESGEKYLDAIAGLGVNALGHSHPEIVQAVQEQASRYMHLSNLYIQDVQVELAEKLIALSGFEKVFLTNSGTEAVEGALKLARKYFSSTEKTELVGISNCFHGRTFGALSVMDKSKYRDGFAPFVGDAIATKSYSEEDLLRSVSDKTAAVIIEPIQGEGGIIEIPISYVTLLHQLRERHGFLIIADEIQSGIGRTGKFFAFEHYGLKPDIVIVAKAIGGGLPMGAILANNSIASCFKAGVHGTTFGGNALACAAGLVVLTKIQDGMMDQVQVESNSFRTKLEDLRNQFPQSIKEVRGKGFMIGIEFSKNVKSAYEKMLERGIITNVTANSVLRLLPPLLFSAEHSDIVVKELGTILSEE